MSDVIANAKRLLERATPGPWSHDDAPGPGGDPMRETEVYQKSGAGVIAYVQPLQGDIELIAAAPELAQALAEEEYQYGVTYTGLKHGGHHIEWVEPTEDAEFDKETLQLLVKRWERKGQFPKIVRRRVSPPEVINE